MTLSRAAAFSRSTGSAGGGRCKRARRQHFSTDIKHAANAAGVGYGVLGPKGAYLNPCEMVFERLKCLLADWTPSTGPVRYDSFGCVICGPQDWNEFQCAMTEAVQKLNANKKLLRSFFHDRCEGYGFERRWAGTPIFEEVEPNVKPFDLAKKLLRPVMSVRDESPPETRAQAASYAQWWLANSRFPEMVPDGPVPGPACALDQFGEEKLCRACGKGTGRKDPQEVTPCSGPGCTASWHWKCLGICQDPRFHRGDWFCPICERAPGRKSWPQWPAAPRSKPAAGAKRKANLLASSDDDDTSEDEC